MQNILTKRSPGVKYFPGMAVVWLWIVLSLGGCLPPLPPEADRPPDPAVVVPPERHRGRAQIFALENYNQLLLFERSARKRSRSWVFDREGIRFEEQKGEVVLVITGRYFWKFDANRINRQEEAEELWRKIIGPFLEEMFLKGHFKMGFDSVLVEVRFERENSAGKNLTLESKGSFRIKTFMPGVEPKPKSIQNFLSRTEAQIDGKIVVLRANILEEEPEY